MEPVWWWWCMNRNFSSSTTQQHTYIWMQNKNPFHKWNKNLSIWCMEKKYSQSKVNDGKIFVYFSVIFFCFTFCLFDFSERILPIYRRRHHYHQFFVCMCVFLPNSFFFLIDWIKIHFSTNTTICYCDISIHRNIYQQIDFFLVNDIILFQSFF